MTAVTQQQAGAKPAPSAELLCSCWTSAGRTGPMFKDQRGRFPLRDRIRQASEAGFTGFGFVHADLIQARDDHEMGYPALRALLGEHGITVVEVEMLNDWFTTGDERRASNAVRQDLLDAAVALGARHIKAGGHMGAGHPVPWEVIVAEFAELGRQAAALGIKVALEPMPFTNIPDLPAGRRLVDEAGEPGLRPDDRLVARRPRRHLLRRGRRDPRPVHLRRRARRRPRPAIR